MCKEYIDSLIYIIEYGGACDGLVCGSCYFEGSKECEINNDSIITQAAKDKLLQIKMELL
jgi:hypothetical protein